MKRIGIIQILQEKNYFNPILTVRQDYENFGVGRGREVLTKYGNVGELDGFIQGLKKWPEPVQPVAASFQLATTLDRSCEPATVRLAGTGE